MSKINYKTKWSTYLGELRPILGIEVDAYEPLCIFSGYAVFTSNEPSPTPSATPTNTPEVSPSQTPTNTPTQTQTQTQTQTPTNTASQTQTPTPTKTPTNTPSATPTIPAFSPASVPDLYQWFDAAAANTYSTRISGGTTYVTSWSGRTGAVVTQANLSLQPQLVAGANDLPYSAVTFNGAGVTLSGATSVATPSGNTTFIVSYNPNGVDSLEFAINTDNGESVSSQYNNYNVVEGRVVGRKVNFVQWDEKPLYPKSLLVVSGNPSSASGTLNDLVSNTSSSFSYGSTMTGIRISDASASSEGAIYEIIVYNRTLTPTEINNVISYLKTKWNYTGWAVTPTPTRTPTQTPSNTPAQFNYYNVEAYDKAGCTLQTTGVLKLEDGGTGVIGHYYCNGASIHKYKLISKTTGPSYTWLMNLPTAHGVNCGSLSCP